MSYKLKLHDVCKSINDGPVSQNNDNAAAFQLINQLIFQSESLVLYNRVHGLHKTRTL